jgi:hypothetical protein
MLTLGEELHAKFFNTKYSVKYDTISLGWHNDRGDTEHEFASFETRLSLHRNDLTNELEPSI